jgi:hypothetical protein
MESGDKFRFARTEDLFLQCRFYLDDCTSFFVLILFLLLVGVGCDRHNDLHSVLQSTKNVEAQGTGEILPILNCPETPFPMLQSSNPKTGNHSVFLSWKASPASNDPDKNPAGYCIYRSRRKDMLQRDPTCGECELVNLKPVRSTDCIDDLVQDGVTYYYVVTAISRYKNLSSPSNQIQAAIPEGDKPVSPKDWGVHTPCRTPIGPK